VDRTQFLVSEKDLMCSETFKTESKFVCAHSK